MKGRPPRRECKAQRLAFGIVNQAPGGGGEAGLWNRLPHYVAWNFEKIQALN